MTSPPRPPLQPTTAVIQQETPILLAHPAQLPEALIDALRRELSGLPNVKGAWLMLAIRGGEQAWMLGIEQTGAWADVQAALARALVDQDVLEGRPLDALDIDQSDLADTLRTGIPILRKRGLLSWLGF